MSIIDKVGGRKRTKKNENRVRKALHSNELCAQGLKEKNIVSLHVWSMGKIDKPVEGIDVVLWTIGHYYCSWVTCSQPQLIMDPLLFS